MKFLGLKASLPLLEGAKHKVVIRSYRTPTPPSMSITTWHAQSQSHSTQITAFKTAVCHAMIRSRRTNPYQNVEKHNVSSSPAFLKPGDWTSLADCCRGHVVGRSHLPTANGERLCGRQVLTSQAVRQSSLAAGQQRPGHLEGGARHPGAGPVHSHLGDVLPPRRSVAGE